MAYARRLMICGFIGNVHYILYKFSDNLTNLCHFKKKLFMFNFCRQVEPVILNLSQLKDNR